MTLIRNPVAVTQVGPMLDMSSIKDRGVIGFDLRMEPNSNLASLEKEAKEQRFSDDVPDIWISADPAFLRRPEDVDQIIQEEYPHANVMYHE